MKMFKRRKHNEPNQNPLQDKVAGKIAGFFILLQTKFSNVMDKRFNKLPVQRMKLFLLGFCVLSGGLSIYFLVSALTAKPKSTFKIDQVRMPQHFDRSGDEVMEGVMPEDIYQQIREYRHYMDSTGQTIRPGLQDSMRILEEMYLQQQK